MVSFKGGEKEEKEGKEEREFSYDLPKKNEEGKKRKRKKKERKRKKRKKEKKRKGKRKGTNCLLLLLRTLKSTQILGSGSPHSHTPPHFFLLFLSFLFPSSLAFLLKTKNDWSTSRQIKSNPHHIPHPLSQNDKLKTTLNQKLYSFLIEVGLIDKLKPSQKKCISLIGIV